MKLNNYWVRNLKDATRDSAMWALINRKPIEYEERRIIEPPDEYDVARYDQARFDTERYE